MRTPLALLLLLLAARSWGPVNGIHPECRFQLEIHEEEIRCMEFLKNVETDYKGCFGVWDNITCWHPAEIGETVTVPCPKVFRHYFSKPGNVSKNCTSDGWSETFPDFITACGYKDDDDEEDYKVSSEQHQLPADKLTDASVFCSQAGCKTGLETQKLHCTRNYIHLNLFLSFILRAISVLVKDDILYSNSNTAHCPKDQISWVGCKASLVFFQYCVMANFYWLLVEGLYLYVLLVVIFSPNRHFLIYLLMGWGIPTIFIISWVVTRIYLDDSGCWDTTEHNVPWWVIRSPILISIIANFILFISIIRILLQKLRSPDVGGNDQSQYKRLAKSTLLLIPLFGVHYMVFAVFPIRISNHYQIIFELCLGSFQGLVVAVLYCFLNSEVQSELKRKWRSLCLNTTVGRDYRLHSSSISRNGSESISQLHRNSRAQSFMQTETTMI
ncbi:vasoactive intestinal polypeptide receptor 2 isoform B [Alligator mississippiensis]|uniref:Vasoactive intestinal polypeptide receptor 2 n=1 Tax=Alligator mississippiensis TaxID=8496 RepID=A0A151PCZ0_ALLMI|nr:vasoactive intestinal polypeptide receptor 2 isoform B [Alligator mississippiensis]